MVGQRKHARLRRWKSSTRRRALAHAAAIGLSDALVRVSVGIENERDLIADFGQALT